MDAVQISQLADEVIRYLGPLAPHLMQVGEKAFDTIKDEFGKKIGKKGAEALVSLAGKVRDRLNGSESGSQAANALAESPDDTEIQKAFRDQIVALLNADSGWAKIIAADIAICRAENVSIASIGEITIAPSGQGDTTVIIGGTHTHAMGSAGLAVEQATAPTIDARHQLPPDLPDFQGREDHIKTLLETFTKADGGAAAVVSALGGMGGVGKTALAVHVAHRLKGTYPDAQIVVDMQGLSETPLAPEAAMARVVQAFDPGFSPPEDAAQLAGIYRSVLGGARALVILDNALDAAQVKDLMPPPPSAALVTSRARIALPGAGSIDLDALPPEEAKALLAAVMAPERTLPDGETEALAEACFRLPLALRAAGAYLKGRPDVAVAEYVSDLGDERKRLKLLKYDPAGLDVGAALGLSAKQLQRENADLAARWRMLAAFPAGFNAPAAAAVWGAGDELDEELETQRILTRATRLNVMSSLVSDQAAGVNVNAGDRSDPRHSPAAEEPC
ncbi:MAG: hypothetical protein IIC55_07765 [Proteobacteria bacterium]|nr:hypothetical protein [Pseudomonadota bacterium]